MLSALLIPVFQYCAFLVRREEYWYQERASSNQKKTPNLQAICRGGLTGLDPLFGIAKTVSYLGGLDVEVHNGSTRVVVECTQTPRGIQGHGDYIPDWPILFS